MPAALTSKRVDAAWIVEPFFTIAQDQGGTVIASNFVDAADDLVVSLYFTREQALAKNPDLARRFTAAINTSFQYAEDHPDEVRKALQSYTKIPPEVAARITLTAWPQEINRASISTLADLMREDGTLQGNVDLNALLP
jgi:NitT/TauT family transport system substrate-binding protein